MPPRSVTSTSLGREPLGLTALSSKLKLAS